MFEIINSLQNFYLEFGEFFKKAKVCLNFSAASNFLFMVFVWLNLEFFLDSLSDANVTQNTNTKTHQVWFLSSLFNFIFVLPH